MRKVFEMRLKIVISSPEEEPMLRLWHKCKAKLLNRPLIDPLTPQLDLLQQCARNFYKQILNDVLFGWLYGHNEYILSCLSIYNIIEPVFLKRGEYGYGVKVLKRGTRGLVLKAMWKIKLEGDRATLVLYSPFPSSHC